MYIDRNIKYLRNLKRYSQGDLADLIGKTPSTISSYETKKAEPPVSILVELSRIFEVPVEDLIFIDLTTEKPSERDKRLKNDSINYAKQIEDGTIAIDEVADKIGDYNLHKVAMLMELRINELERAIKEDNPELAKLLKIK